MDKNAILQRQHKILCNLSALPQKILSLHDHNNITELVLYSLCGEHCFNLNKAAYFVDNPDFNCLQGIAGFSRDQKNLGQPDVLQQADYAGEQLRIDPFNKKVRSMSRCSLKNGVREELAMAQDIAKDLNIANPQVCVWPMKHDNHGLLIFEQQKGEVENYPQDYLVNGCSLLGFCPIY